MIGRTQKQTIILASKSPRRQMLLKELGIDFIVRTKNTEENYPTALKAEKIPLYLSKIKADAFENDLEATDILITADTIVWINGRALNKPENLDQAKEMLSELSGKRHEVYTGVYMKTTNKTISFFDKTAVYFKNLTTTEIDYYVENYKPLDKAGAYGIQEWIGYIGIERFDGCYYNVMGLPLRKVYATFVGEFSLLKILHDN